jgi:hypothetical protein
MTFEPGQILKAYESEVLAAKVAEHARTAGGRHHYDLVGRHLGAVPHT